MTLTGELQAFLDATVPYTEPPEPVTTSTEGIGSHPGRIRVRSENKPGEKEDELKFIPHTITITDDKFVAHVYMTVHANEGLDPVVFMLSTGNEASVMHITFCGDIISNDVWLTLISLLNITKVQTIAHLAVAPNTAALAAALSCKECDIEELSVANVTPMELGTIDSDKLVLQEVADMRKYEDILIDILISKGAITKEEYDTVTKTKHTLQLIGKDLIERLKPKAPAVTQ